jgi:hypothetical protein
MREYAEHVTSEQFRRPPTIIQASRTVFYEALQNRELERRQQLSEAMKWFRPVDRIMKQRAIAQIDRLLLSVTATLEDSRAADTAMAQNESAVVQAATDIVTTAQNHLEPTYTLDNDAAAEAASPIIENC